MTICRRKRKNSNLQKEGEEWSEYPTQETWPTTEATCEEPGEQGGTSAVSGSAEVAEGF